MIDDNGIGLPLSGTTDTNLQTSILNRSLLADPHNLSTILNNSSANYTDSVFSFMGGTNMYINKT